MDRRLEIKILKNVAETLTCSPLAFNIRNLKDKTKDGVWYFDIYANDLHVYESGYYADIDTLHLSLSPILQEAGTATISLANDGNNATSGGDAVV